MTKETMTAVRLHADGELRVEQVPLPEPRSGEVLVRVHAAAITRDELDWPVDRLPAIPSYELSGTVVDTGREVWALTPFSRDGVAAEYAAVPADVLAPKPQSLSHVEAAAVPMTGLSAWQGLFAFGGLESGQRVEITGAAGGVGHVAVQLAKWRGAHVVEDQPADLVFDTVGGVSSPDGGSLLVSIAEESEAGTYFVVEPDRGQLAELGRLVEAGELRPAIDSVFALADAERAFKRVAERGKTGKVVLRVVD
jgi:NADPH:quinone reductase-like Zn-dependent oxidoreductase